MARITHGNVTYERRIRTGDFEHKQASAVIHFEVAEGDDADQFIVTAGMLIARTHVHRVLGLEPPNPVNGLPATEEVKDEPVSDLQLTPFDLSGPVQTQGIPPQMRKPRRKKSEVIADPDDGAPAMCGPIDAGPVDDFTTAAAPEITDVELGAALTAKNMQLKDSARIRKFIGEYVQTGQSYSLVPQARRAEFLTKLEALG